ncbi:MAG: DUF1801 domain-containing protein [Pseudomonadota bacterium]
MTDIDNAAVAAAVTALPPDTRAGVLALRALILGTASGLPDAQPLQEALRWGQPSYLAPKGSTIRVGGHKSARFALFVHCRTRLLTDFALTFPDADRTDGNRAVLFDDISQIDQMRHGWLIARALTYHL